MFNDKIFKHFCFSMYELVSTVIVIDFNSLKSSSVFIYKATMISVQNICLVLKSEFLDQVLIDSKCQVKKLTKLRKYYDEYNSYVTQEAYKTLRLLAESQQIKFKLIAAALTSFDSLMILLLIKHQNFIDENNEDCLSKM